MSDRHLKPKKIATRYGVKIDTVYVWIQSGELPAIDVSCKRGGRARYAISAAGLAEFEAKRAIQKPAKAARRRKKQPTGIHEYF